MGTFLITGFPYPYILDNLFNAPGELGLTNICEQYYNMYQSQSGTYQSGTIVLVKCSELDNLATVCANAVSESRDAMAEVRRMGVQHYFYNDTNDYFFDFAHYYEQFTSASRFAEFSAQLDKAVPYKASTQRFLNLKIEHYCGLSCYIPKDAYPILNAHYKQLAWNQKVKVIE